MSDIKYRNPEFFVGFDRQLAAMPPHEKPGFIDSAYAQVIHVVAENVLAMTQDHRDFHSGEDRHPLFSFEQVRYIEHEWSTRNLRREGRLSLSGITSAMRKVIDKHDPRGTFSSHADKLEGLAEHTKLANRLKVGMDEFTLDELRQLGSGSPHAELEARYSRFVPAGKITPYEFFNSGTAFVTPVQPYTEIAEATDDDRHAVRIDNPWHRYTAGQLAYRHTDGINNGNTINQYWAMPDGKTWRSVVHTPVRENGNPEETQISLEPVGHDARPIEITQDMDQLPGFETTTFEVWYRRILIGNIVNFIGGQRSRSGGGEGHVERVNYMRSQDTTASL